MSRRKQIRNVILILITSLVTFGFWYNYTYGMRVVKSMEYNDSTSDTKLLVLTQGSTYKNKLTSEVIDHYKNDGTYIKMLDVTNVGDMDIAPYDAILLLHTWEKWEPPKAVFNFITNHPDLRNLVVHTTSGDANYKMEGIDAITGASVLDSIPMVKEKIIDKIDEILAH